MKITDGVGYAEQRLEIHVQPGVTELRDVHQRDIAMGGLQGQGEVNGDGGGAAASLGVHDCKNFAARSLPMYFSLRSRQSDKSFQKIGGSSRPFNKLARSRPHSVHNHLGLRHTANGKQCRVGQFLMK